MVSSTLSMGNLPKHSPQNYSLFIHFSKTTLKRWSFWISTISIASFIQTLFQSLSLPSSRYAKNEIIPLIHDCFDQGLLYRFLDQCWLQKVLEFHLWRNSGRKDIKWFVYCMRFRNIQRCGLRIKYPLLGRIQLTCISSWASSVLILRKFSNFN